MAPGSTAGCGHEQEAKGQVLLYLTGPISPVQWRYGRS